MSKIKAPLTYIFFWMLCFAAPLSFPVLPVHGGQERTQSEYMAPLDRQVVILIHANRKASESKDWHYSLFHRFKKRERLFHRIIMKVSKRYQVDPALVKAIILAESEYNPYAISRKGAKGLMQLMPGTARVLGVEDIFDPEHNIKGGVRHIKGLLKMFEGDVRLAIAAYNAGSIRVRRYKGIPPFKATIRYVRNVSRYYEIYKQHM
jgi:soluble lytic murein transglycosylase-like protein